MPAPPPVPFVLRSHRRVVRLGARPSRRARSGCRPTSSGPRRLPPPHPTGTTATTPASTAASTRVPKSRQEEEARLLVPASSGSGETRTTRRREAAGAAVAQALQACRRRDEAGSPKGCATSLRYDSPHSAIPRRQGSPASARLCCRAAVARNAVPQSLLFAGPDGVGKRLAALALAPGSQLRAARAPALRRRAARAARSPAACIPTCCSSSLATPDRSRSRRFARLSAEPAYRPFEGRRRVTIIDQADALVPNAQDALLKTLEEPPPGSIFVLVTAQAGRAAADDPVAVLPVAVRPAGRGGGGRDPARASRLERAGRARGRGAGRRQRRRGARRAHRGSGRGARRGASTAPRRGARRRRSAMARLEQAKALGGGAERDELAPPAATRRPRCCGTSARSTPARRPRHPGQRRPSGRAGRRSPAVTMQSAGSTRSRRSTPLWTRSSGTSARKSSPTGSRWSFDVSELRLRTHDYAVESS